MLRQNREARRKIWNFRVRFVSEKLNRRIIDKIRSAPCDKAIKELLLELLYFELENIEEAYPHYTKFYDYHINRFAKGFEMKDHEV